MEIKLEVTSKRLVATSFVTEIETLRGTESTACSFDATVQLVDTQLEMVCPDRLPYNLSSLFCLRRCNCDDRFSAIKSAEPYKDALARAKMNPAVIEALGSPIKEGFFVSGNTNVNSAAGEANLATSDLRPEGQGHNLRKGGEVARALELFRSGCRNPGNAKRD